MKIKNIANILIFFLFIVLNSWGNNETKTNEPNENFQNNILIISATKAEIEEINKIIQNKKSISIEEHRRKKKITIGKVLDHNIITIATGVGKINTAFWTSYIISKYKISHIISAGVASGIYSNKNKFIKVGDVIISTETTSYDFNLHRFGYEIGHVPEHPKKFKANTALIRKASKIKINNATSYMGLIITGDQFIDHQNFQEIPEEFENAIAIDMEGASMAQVAYNFKIPFIIIRGISDIVNNENNHDDYKKFLKKASSSSAKIIEKLIRLM
ncbi:5'-methylthioadenosine/adenosylhomocysteine nucleosidase [Borreliella tanukii]|uniref:5'-methylthioadenosine/adenosylhomocysteine nucleosidase n=1 Tax=Borreliella tanukii TaxID=56146 RepID=UPI002649FB7A|nr:5'-methylthioadenosine/adenosylhomocysteine nucleosidase [Borreliella tanukii]WKC81123.1 5'-methylthioadenosine/adenosylhomocysteine nucleosidase [Borreliella tanukii]